MLYGFNGKLLRVNLSTGEIRNEAIPDDILKKYLGGAGVALHFLLKELDRGIDPLSLIHIFTPWSLFGLILS